MKKWFMLSLLILVCLAIPFSVYAQSLTPIDKSHILILDKQALDWGTIYPGTRKVKTLTITNNYSYPSHLTFSSINWIPKNADNYLTFSTDYDDVSLKPYESRDITLFLDVDPTVKDVSSFGFDIDINSKIRYHALHYDHVDTEKGPHFICQVCDHEFYALNFNVIYDSLKYVSDFNQPIIFRCPECGAEIKLYVALHKYRDGSIGIVVQKTSEEGKGGIDLDWHVREAEPLQFSP